MPTNAITQLTDPQGFSSDPLTDLLRSGAQRLIEQAVEAKRDCLQFDCSAPCAQDDLRWVPRVVWVRAVPADTSGKIRVKQIDLKADHFAADDEAGFRKNILDIGRAEGKAMVCPKP